MEKKIHAKVRDQGLLNHNLVLGTALIDMYAKCGALETAHHVFNELPDRNVFCWSALISGYAKEGLGYEALECFRQMVDEGVSPNVVTYACILKACAAIGSLEIGEDIRKDY